MRQIRSAGGVMRSAFARGKKKWHPPVAASRDKAMKQILERRMAFRWPLIMLLAFLSPGLPAQTPADDGEISLGQVQSGSLLLRMKSGYTVATRMNTDIGARISGMVARVSVSQTFRNTGEEWVEGVYVFPLPDGAAVDQLRLHIGGRYIEGEIREKEQAKKAYEAAKVAGKKASLIEQQRANLFTTSVANVAPGETVTIEIEYLETLRYDDESFSIRFPLTITPRYIPGSPLPGRKGSGWSPDTDRVADASLVTPPVVAASTDHRITFHASIDAGVPLQIIASRYHPITVIESPDSYEISLTGSAVPLDHDLELTWKPVAAAVPRAMLFAETVDRKPYLLLMMLPPNEAITPHGETAREMIFVIDTSGSMHGTSLAQASRALSLALDGLRPADRFNIIQFNSTTSALFPAAVDASANKVGIAKRYVAGLSANGGTEMRPAIEHALLSKASETHLRQVIFITDGSVGNEQELFGIIEKHLGDARLFTVGIGSAPNSWFMRKAAEAGRGTFTLISALHEVNEKMSRLFRKLEQPQLTDVVEQWPGGQSPEVYPGKVPDLYSGEPVIVRARLDVAPQAAGIITVSGNSAHGTWGAEIPVSMQQESGGVAALWARARIEDLLDQQRRGAHADEIREEIVATALAHHLVSKHTSLVAVDKTPARPADQALGNEQVPSLLPYGQNHNAIFGFPATATAAGIYRASGLLLILFALLLALTFVPGSRHRAFAQNA
jgi:Ca-activated chloride channel family protein